MSTAKMTSSINDTLYPAVKKVMDSKSSQFKNLVGNFIKKHYEELYDIVPCDRIYFMQDEVDELKKVMGKEVFDIATKAIANTYYADIPNFNPNAAKDEVTLILLMIVKYFSQKGNNKDLELACIYLSFSGKFYVSVHSGVFPYKPSRNVMEYCVNYLMTQKFDLVREGSVIGAVKSISNTWINTYKDSLKNGDDEDVKHCIQQLRDRIKSFLQNVASVYYEAYENKDYYLSYDTENHGEENYRTVENNSNIIERTVESTMNYITTNGVNYKFVKSSADTNVKFDELKMIIETIQNTPDNIRLIKELISLILTIYVNNTGNLDFRTVEFVSKSLSAKPNAKDKNMIRQKEILEILLNENSVHYKRRKKREGTRSSYHRSLLSYYVLLINHCANK